MKWTDGDLGGRDAAGSDCGGRGVWIRDSKGGKGFEA